jgi:hypothetical protein
MNNNLHIGRSAGSMIEGEQDYLLIGLQCPDNVKEIRDAFYLFAVDFKYDVPYFEPGFP